MHFTDAQCCARSSRRGEPRAGVGKVDEASWVAAGIEPVVIGVGVRRLEVRERVAVGEYPQCASRAVRGTRAARELQLEDLQCAERALRGPELGESYSRWDLQRAAPAGCGT